MTEDYLCIIPAKAASTRIKKKNIVDLCGRPLIYYTIEAAKASALFKDIYVSTEDDKVKTIAESFGAIVPYKRPEELSRDPAGVVEVCLHMIDFLEKKGKLFKALCILLPTCPLRTAEDIHLAVETYHVSDAKVLMSVSEFNHSPFFSLRMDDKGMLSPYFPEFITKKSQEIPKVYRCNGAITILDMAEFKRQKRYYFYPMASYIMPLEKSVDIDTYIDLKLAECIMNNKKEVYE